MHWENRNRRRMSKTFPARKKKEEEEKRKKEEDLAERKRKELIEHRENFERRCEDAFKSKTYFDLFNDASIPEQYFTLAVKERIYKIFCWQKKREVTIKKLEERAKDFSSQKSGLAQNLKVALDKLGSKYSLEQMQQAIQELETEDSDDDDFSKNRDSSDDDMPRPITDESGLMPLEGVAYEDPYDYIVRLKQKYTSANEQLCRENKLVFKQLQNLNEITSEKLALQDRKIIKIKEEHAASYKHLWEKVKENNETLSEVKTIINKLIETKYLKENEVKLEEKLQKEKEKYQQEKQELHQLMEETKRKLNEAIKIRDDEISNLKKATPKESASQASRNKRHKEEIEELEEELAAARKMSRKAEQLGKDVQSHKTQIDHLTNELAEKDDENVQLQMRSGRLKKEVRGLEKLIEEADERLKETTDKLIDEHLADLTRVKEEHDTELRQFALANDLRIGNLKVLHDEEIAQIRRDITEPLVLLLHAAENKEAAATSANFRLKQDMEDFERDMKKLKEQWDYVLDVEKTIAYNKGFKEAKMWQVSESECQTEATGYDKITEIQPYVPQAEWERLFDAYTSMIDTTPNAKDVPGEWFLVNEIKSNKMKWFTEHMKDTNRYVKWSDESVARKFVEQSISSGAATNFLRYIDEVQAMRSHYRLLLIAFEDTMKERELQCNKALEEANLREVDSMIRYNKATEEETTGESQYLSFSSAERREFVNLLNEINEWEINLFFEETPKKFFSYFLNQWKPIYDSTFLHFNKKFYNVKIDKLSREQSKVMFKLLVKLNILTGSRSHIWYGNQLNRKFNGNDYIKGHAFIGTKDEFHLLRAQHTFFDWYGEDAKVAYKEMTVRLRTRASNGYKILLTSIGSTYIARELGLGIISN
jgi:hypothetical protein